MAQQSYVKNAAILTATGLALRAAGMFFRIYLAARIGAEGMGLYQLIYTVYNMAVTVATAGLSVAATRLSAQLLATDDAANARAAMRRVLALGLGLGLAAAVLLFAGAGLAAEWWLKDTRAALSLRVLAPSLPFMSVSACLRGFFLARRKVGPNSRAQIFEQIVRIGVVAACIDAALPYGEAASCAAVMLGSTVSEAASWAYMEWCYRRELRAVPRRARQPVHGLSAQLWAILAPIAANQYLTGLLRTVENVMVPGCLALFTGDRAAALSQYGALKGMAMPVIFFPFSFLATISTLLLPEITEAHTQGRRAALERLISRVMLVTLALSVLAGGLFTQFAREIGLVLYQSEEVGFYLSVLGPLMPFMYLESMVDGILKGLGEQLSSFRYAALDSVVRMALIALLLPRLGMKGFLFVMLVSNLLTSLLNLHRLLTVTGLRVRWMRWVVKPVLSMICAGTACRFLLWPLAKRLCLPLLGWTIAGAAFTAAVYLLFLWLTGCAAPSDFLPVLPRRKKRRS